MVRIVLDDYLLDTDVQLSGGVIDCDFLTNNCAKINFSMLARDLLKPEAYKDYRKLEMHFYKEYKKIVEQAIEDNLLTEKKSIYNYVQSEKKAYETYTLKLALSVIELFNADYPANNLKNS